MKCPNAIILYVREPAASAQFYHQLFGAPIVESSANFAMLILEGGTMLGLWAEHDVSPTPAGRPAGWELAVTTASAAETDAALAQARQLGAPIVQEPVQLDFGYTFVLAAPDGHLVRVFTPS